jgi:hypothetical protein
MNEEAKQRYIKELTEKAMVHYEAAKQLQSSTNLPMEQCIELIKTAEISLSGDYIDDAIRSLP